MDLKHLAAKVVSISLILFGLYQIFLSLDAIFFVYPNLGKEGYSLAMQKELFQKAVFIYLGTIVNGIYGFILFFKPAHEIKVMNILTGIALGVVSFLLSFGF